MAGIMVVNVDTWGSGPNALRGGDVVPSDCPGDLQWATDNKVIVTEDEYRVDHPDWKPPVAKEEAETKPAETKPAETRPATTGTTTAAPATTTTTTKPS